MMYRDRAIGVLFGLGLFVFVGSMVASAGIINDAPESLADSLGVTTIAAEYILSAAVLLSVGLALALFKGSNMAATVIVLLAFIGMLTAIGWLDAWLLIMVALIIALMFGSQLREWGTSTFRKG